MDSTLDGPERYDLPDLSIETLGEPTIESPLRNLRGYFVDDSERVLYHSTLSQLEKCKDSENLPAFEKAGPREKLFFDPGQVNCGIVTCGGLCPGINDVIRTITLTLIWQYGVKKVYGFKYGYVGMTSNAPADPVLLDDLIVESIHEKGGSILSSSRGPQDSKEIVDNLVKRDIGILFVIGGDGTLRGAHELVQRIRERDIDIAVVGIPKTIDNDISGIETTFGYSTAVEACREAIIGAHQEAKGAYNGIGLVKLMGRDSGFIATYAALANADVNFVLIPEMPLVLDGAEGLLKTLEQRIQKKHHAVIVVAEGTGQELFESDKLAKDASGNVLHHDIGLLLKDRIKRHFSDRGITVAIKYIDPSYIIRSQPANSRDSAFCLLLGQMAVHAAMSGRTDMVVGYWNQNFTHVPISLAISKRKKVNTEGILWQTVSQITGRPMVIKDL